MTQSSSSVRLKFVKLGDADLKNLYSQYDALSTVDFQKFCTDLIQSGSGGKVKKHIIINAVQFAVDKSKILKTTQDFILAGMGLGV